MAARHPAWPREIGHELSPRLVIGWDGLREKIFLASIGLDDAAAELMKLAIIRGIDMAPGPVGVEFRVDDKTETMLRMNWVRASSGETIDAVNAPVELHKTIEVAAEARAGFRNRLSDGPVVDIHKLKCR